DRVDEHEPGEIAQAVRWQELLDAGPRLACDPPVDALSLGRRGLPEVHGLEGRAVAVSREIEEGLLERVRALPEQAAGDTQLVALAAWIVQRGEDAARGLVELGRRGFDAQHTLHLVRGGAACARPRHPQGDL